MVSVGVCQIGLLTLSASCGRIGFEATVDARPDGDVPSIDTPSIDAFILPHATPFSTPTPITALNSTTEDLDPTMTADGLEIYFASFRPGGVGLADIWRAARGTMTSAWNPPAPVTELNSTALDLSPEVSRDGLVMWLSSNRSGSAGSSDLWIATRPTRAASWSPPVVVAALSSALDDHSPSLTADQLVIFFDSTRGGTARLYQATRTAIGSAWSTPQPVTELEVPTFITVDPAISDDGLTLFYGAGPSSNDIYSTVRPSRTSMFAPGQLHPELTLRFNNTDPWLTVDRTQIVFSARISGGQFDLFEASR